MNRVARLLLLLPLVTMPALSAAQTMDKMDKMDMPAHSGNKITAFSNAALAAAQKAGRPILVDVHADWCPVCRAQAPVIEKLAADPANAKVVFLRLDFDSQRNERAALRATSQSTLIAFRGRKETGRLQGVTNAGQISRLVASSLK